MKRRTPKTRAEVAQLDMEACEGLKYILHQYGAMNSAMRGVLDREIENSKRLLAKQ